MVERFNRTLQEGLAVLKRHEPCLSLQKALVRFLKAYNARPHRRLQGLAPRQITLANTRDFFAFKIGCCKIWLFTVGTDVLLLNFESATTCAPVDELVPLLTLPGQYRMIKRRGISPRFEINLYALEILLGRPLPGRYYQPELRCLPYNPTRKTIRKTLAQDKRYKMQTVEYYDHPTGHRETIPL